MKRKTILIVGIFTIISILSIFAFIRTSGEASLYKGCLESDDKSSIICLDVKSAVGKELKIVTDPVIPTPGQKFTTTIEFQIPSISSGVKLAVLNMIQNYGSRDLVNKWDATDSVVKYCATGSCAVFIETTFYAPSTPGDYILFFVITDNTNLRVYQEEFSFKVGGNVCPADSCSSWNFLLDVPNGEWNSRNCFVYSSAPTCTRTSSNEYSTVCDSGYVVKNTDSNVADYKELCVKSDAVCDDGVDGGRNTEVKGITSKGSTSSTDICVGGTQVKEFYCSGSFVLGEIIECDTGSECVSGACIVTDSPPICTQVAGQLCNPTTKEIATFTDGCGQTTLIGQGYSTADVTQCAQDPLVSCEDVVCESDNLCSTSSCNEATGQCESTIKDCGTSYCEIETGQCKSDVDSCIIYSDCTEVQGHDVVCDNSECKYSIVSITNCKLYERLSDDNECKFSFDAILNNKGASKNFYDDFTTPIVTIGALLFLVLVLAIYLIFKDKNEGGI